MFGVVSLTKHVDIDQYKYSGYGVGFDRKGVFSFGNGFGRNCIIFGADMSISVHANNKTKKGLVKTLYKELTIQQFMQKNCIRLILLKTMVQKTKDSEIVTTPLCLGNISKDFSVDNMKKTGLNSYVYVLVLIMMLLQLMIY